MSNESAQIVSQEISGEDPNKQLANRTAQPADYDLQTKFTPSGDQPEAIAELLEGVDNDERDRSA